MKIAILDDYQNVALKMADWSALSERAEITVFRRGKDKDERSTTVLASQSEDYGLEKPPVKKVEAKNLLPRKQSVTSALRIG